MPAWLAILLLMLLPVLAINPSSRDDAWYRALRRPLWLRFHLWIPLFWLLIYAGIYGAALRSWLDSGRAAWVLGLLLVVVLVETAGWFLCTFRRLGSAVWFQLGLWAYGLVLALALAGVSPVASLMLLPFLLWLPVETLAVWQIRAINHLP